MSFALSAKLLALGMEDEPGTVLLWDLEKGSESRLASGHAKKTQFSGYGVSALAFTADSKTLITAGREGAVKTWDVEARKELRAIANAYPSWIETLAVTPDGQRLACAGQEGLIRHWDLTTGGAMDAQASHGQRVTGVSVTPDGRAAVTACTDHRLRVWDLATGRQQRAIPLPPTQSSWPQAAMAPDGRTVVVTVADKIKAWNVASGQEVPLSGQLGDVKTRNVKFTADGKILLCVHDNAVALFDWPSGKLRRRFVLPEPAVKPGEAYCDAATLSPDGRWLATLAHRSWHRDDRGMRFGYGADHVLDLWNATNGERVHRLVDGGDRTATFTSEGDLLFAGGGNLHPLASGGNVPLQGQFHLVDPLTGRLKRSFEPAPKLPGASHYYNTAIELAPDGRSVCCAGNDGLIHIYETATGKIRRSLSRHRGYVGGLAFTADGRRLLSASFDLTALVWDISLASDTPKGAAPPTPDDQAKLWDQLLGENAAASYEAMAALAAHPQVAVLLIRAGIKPVASSPSDATLDRIVADLDDDAIAVRDRASRELDALGEAAVAGVRARLAKEPSAEARLRLIKFLDKHDPVTPTPVQLREIRALEILEQLNSPESRTALAELAKGAANARLTRAAAAALARQKRVAADSDP